MKLQVPHFWPRPMFWDYRESFLSVSFYQYFSSDSGRACEVRSQRVNILRFAVLAFAVVWVPVFCSTGSSTTLHCCSWSRVSVVRGKAALSCVKVLTPAPPHHSPRHLVPIFQQVLLKFVTKLPTCIIDLQVTMLFLWAPACYCSVSFRWVVVLCCIALLA